MALFLYSSFRLARVLSIRQSYRPMGCSPARIHYRSSFRPEYPHFAPYGRFLKLFLLSGYRFRGYFCSLEYPLANTIDRPPLTHITPHACVLRSCLVLSTQEVQTAVQKWSVPHSELSTWEFLTNFSQVLNKFFTFDTSPYRHLVA